MTVVIIPYFVIYFTLFQRHPLLLGMKKIKGAPGPMARLRRGARLLPMFMSSNNQNERLAFVRPSITKMEVACRIEEVCVVDVVVVVVSGCVEFSLSVHLPSFPE